MREETNMSVRSQKVVGGGSGNAGDLGGIWVVKEVKKGGGLDW